jgi:hypothetical protein
MEKDKFIQKQIDEIDLDPSIVSADRDIYNSTQFFTPKIIIKEMMEKNQEALINLNKTVLDNASGDGAIILYVFGGRLIELEKSNKKSLLDIINALKTLFSIEYEYETIWKQRVIIYNSIYKIIKRWNLESTEIFDRSVKKILINNLKFGAWPVGKDDSAIEFTDYNRNDSVKLEGFPEWHVFPNCNVRIKNY